MFKAQTQRRDAASRSGGRFQILPILLALVASCRSAFRPNNRRQGQTTTVRQERRPPWRRHQPLRLQLTKFLDRCSRGGPCAITG